MVYNHIYNHIFIYTLHITGVYNGISCRHTDTQQLVQCRLLLNLLIWYSESTVETFRDTSSSIWVEFIDFLPLEQWKQDWLPQSTSLRSMRFAGEGLCTAIEYYNLPLAAVVGTSVPAAEHSTITSWTKAGTMVDHDEHGRASAKILGDCKWQKNAHITHHQRLLYYYWQILFFGNPERDENSWWCLSCSNLVT